MTKYIFIENDKINGCGEVMQIDNATSCIEVSDTVYNDFRNDNLKYIYQSGKIVANPKYSAIKKQQETETEISELKTKLEELDKKRIRAICENGIKDETTNETWLEFYNKEIEKIRSKITSL